MVSVEGEGTHSSCLLPVSSVSMAPAIVLYPGSRSCSAVIPHNRRPGLTLSLQKYPQQLAGTLIVKDLSLRCREALIWPSKVPAPAEHCSLLRALGPSLKTEPLLQNLHRGPISASFLFLPALLRKIAAFSYCVCDISIFSICLFTFQYLQTISYFKWFHC